MRVKRLIKTWTFEEHQRSKLTLGTGVRLNPGTYAVELEADDDGEYSTADDLNVATWTTNPKSLKAWLGFESVVVNQTVDGVEVTSFGYRLTDGANQYWWDGGAWAVSTTQWNTESEVAANISAFPVSSQTLGVVVNLKTTDKSVTPQLRELKALMSCDVEFFEDILLRSFVPAVRAGVRPIADLEIDAAAGTTIALDDYPVDTQYNLQDVDSVYNLTTDSDKLADIFSSYDSGTNTITLGAAVADGDDVLVRFTYQPQVAVSSSRDYDEVGKVPAIAVEGVAFLNATRRSVPEGIVNRSDSTAVTVPAPVQGNLLLTLRVDTDKMVDQLRLDDELRRFVEDTPLLTSAALDEDYSMAVVEDYTKLAGGGLNDLRRGRLQVMLYGVKSWMKDAVDGFKVDSFVIQGDLLNITVS